MGSFLNIYIKHDNPEKIAALVQELSGIKEISQGTPPVNLHDYILANDQQNPTLIVIGDVHNGWTNISLNSFKKLPLWTEQLSTRLNTTVVQLIGQTTSDYYYILMYEQGDFRREIEMINGEPDQSINKGEKFSFENFPAEDADEMYSIDDAEAFGKGLGFDIYYENEHAWEPYYILRHAVIGQTFKEKYDKYIQKKPWWKFW